MFDFCQEERVSASFRSLGVSGFGSWEKGLGARVPEDPLDEYEKHLYSPFLRYSKTRFQVRADVCEWLSKTSIAAEIKIYRVEVHKHQ